MRLLIPLLLLVAHSFYGQINFKIVDNKIQWQKVYNDSLNVSNFEKQLLTQGNFENITSSTIDIITTLIDFTSDYKSAGYKRGQTPPVIALTKLKATVIIDIKGNRYRVTVKNIELASTINNAILGKKGEYEPLESWYLKNKTKTFRKNFYDVPANIFNYNFEKLFKIRDKAQEKW